MSRVLVISGHPRLSHSYSNRRILEEIIGLEELTVSDILTIYPDMQVDIRAEQEKLEAADLIIFQFPFVWYGMPSHMKSWLEMVFSEGFAYGTGGGRLKGKSVLLSITLGGDRQAYSSGGQHGHPVELFLQPLEKFCRYCGMDYLPPVYSHAMYPDSNDHSRLERQVQEHVENLVQGIRGFRRRKALDQAASLYI